MTNDGINIPQESPFVFYKKFFEMRTTEHHLVLLDELIWAITNPQHFIKKRIQADVFIIYQLYAELLDQCFQFKHDVNGAPSFAAFNANFIENTKPHFTYHFKHLNEEELANPILALEFLREDTLHVYKNVLYGWLAQFLKHDRIVNNGNIFFPLYHQLRKLIELSWLIYNNFLENTAVNQSQALIGRFEDTCPLLLASEHQQDPYLEIESFFNGASLGYYKYELRSWFKTAITEGMEVDNHGNLIYFHNQLIQLLHAGYLIVTNRYEYISKTVYSSTAKTFKDWVNEVKKEKIDEGNGIPGSYEVYLLSEAEIANPIFYLKEMLSRKRIAEIRYGLQEWIYCAFNKNNSIATMEADYVINLYQELEKFLELLFLLVAG
ncbi:hypothetical protein ASF92_01990 [Pedobacter sp. Leaf176]|nr:hypothetical protein ASF92_01990 [Pedobacter sp. Leaf176]